MKPRRAYLTDAGPGVGVNNHEVRFRDVEINRMHEVDYSIRVHRSTADSGQNEAERTNAASGIIISNPMLWCFIIFNCDCNASPMRLLLRLP